MQLFPHPNAILFILDPNSMPSPNRNKAAALKNKLNRFFANQQKREIARAQQALIRKINKAVGVKYLVQSPNGALMYAVRTPINKSIVKVLKY